MTYDLTVPKEHNFIADDFVVHNSHAASYGIVAYQTAYMKANYPIQYMTAVLIAESGDMDKVPAIIHECGKMDIEVLPPDVNHSFKSFAMIEPEDGGKTHIRFGLSGIKNVGENIAGVIIQERKDNGPYKSILDFLERITDKDLNKKSLESLIKSGGLDSFEERGKLLANLETLLTLNKESAKAKSSNQSSLFIDSPSLNVNSNIQLAESEPAKSQDKLIWEKELLGLYISDHPFNAFKNHLSNYIVPISNFK